MALRKPVKPKLKTLPKRPKMTASKETWDRYYQRVKEVQAYNKKLMAEYKRKLQEYEKEMARRKKIAEQAKKKIA